MSIDERFAVIEAGFSGNTEKVLSALTSTDDAVRASALRALHRLHALTAAHIGAGIADASAEVRRTALEFSAPFTDVNVHHLITDHDVFVAEMAAWSIGERNPASDDEIQALITNTTTHPEAVVREACAAALGSLGDERGLPAILAACEDKPAVRRRAVLALAPFEGEQVEAALTRALEDRDWQVRQNAEILIHPRD